MVARPLVPEAAPVAAQEVVQLGHIRELAKQWHCSLRAQGLSRLTITSYEVSVRQFVEFLEASGMPVQVAAIAREHVEAWITHLLETRSSATASVRFRSLILFWKFCQEEGEITSNPMERMKAPRVIPPRVEVLTEEDRSKLLKACVGSSFEEKRDAGAPCRGLLQGRVVRPRSHCDLGRNCGRRLHQERCEVLGEMRVGFGVFRAKAFCIVDLAV